MVAELEQVVAVVVDELQCIVVSERIFEPLTFLFFEFHEFLQNVLLEFAEYLRLDLVNIVFIQNTFSLFFVTRIRAPEKNSIGV